MSDVQAIADFCGLTVEETELLLLFVHPVELLAEAAKKSKL